MYEDVDAGCCVGADQVREVAGGEQAHVPGASEATGIGARASVRLRLRVRVRVRVRVRLRVNVRVGVGFRASARAIRRDGATLPRSWSTCLVRVLDRALNSDRLARRHGNPTQTSVEEQSVGCERCWCMLSTHGNRG